MLLSRILSFLISTLFLMTAQAGYFVSSKNAPTLDHAKRTHILIAGHGAELSTLFQSAAASKAIKIQELYPQDQIVLISCNEIGAQANAEKLRGWGFQVVSLNNNIFTPQRLMAELARFTKIASLEFFTHTSAIAGAQLEGEAYRISQIDDVSSLKGNFTADSFIYLHGCNSGFNLAPAFSSQLEVPVAGSFTYTGFQKLHSNHEFYDFDDALKPAGDWSAVNDVSFAETHACTSGGCLRMKPDNSPYTGGWGDYNDGGGLPFYKFFCVKNSETRCLNAMAESIYGLIGKKDYKFASSAADYNELLMEFFCPVSNKTNIRQLCVQGLQKAAANNTVYNPFQGKLLTCNFKKCQFEIHCADTAGSCRMENDLPSSNAMVDEYKSYLKAFSIFSNRRN
jgi:hypothetical protein